MTYEREAGVVLGASIAAVLIGLALTVAFRDETGSSLVHSGALVTILSVFLLTREYSRRLTEEKAHGDKAFDSWMNITRAPEKEKEAYARKVLHEREERYQRSDRIIARRYVATTLIGTFVWGFGDEIGKMLYASCPTIGPLTKVLLVFFTFGSWSCGS